MKQVVFIVGLGHSGSTLLSLLLGSHQEAFAVGELIQAADRLRPESTRPFCRICSGPCTFWARPERRESLLRLLGKPPSSRVLASFDSRFGSLRGDVYGRLFDWTKASVLVDSSKSHRWYQRQRLPFWHWRDRRARVLYLVRDGRGVVASALRKYEKNEIDGASSRWRARTLAREKFFSGLPVGIGHKVFYESLTQQPEAELRAICSWLEIDFQPRMLAYWEHEHHPIGGNVGTSLAVTAHQDSTAIEDATESVDRQLTDLDYYSRLGTNITTDQRWMKELSEAQLDTFERVAGGVNRRCCLPPDCT